MGFFSKLFSVDSCPNCGSTDLKRVWDGRYYNSHTIYACRKCEKASLHHKAPLCASCGKPQKGLAYNYNHVVVPKCKYCGHLWDTDEQGWVNLD